MTQPFGTPREPHEPRGPLSPPLVRATTHALPDAESIRAFSVGERHGDFYPRYGHSNGFLWESLVAEAEHAEGAVAFASGMAAMHGAIMALVRAGDRVLIQEQVYGGTEALALHELPRCGVEVLRFDALDREALAAALARSPQVVVLETPINPTLRLFDLRHAAALCQKAGAVTVVDGTFAPPPIQRPLELGIDLVVHSATKFYGGHSDVMAGVVAGRAALLQEVVKWRSRTGAILAPDPAWLLCRSFPTLELRVMEQQRSASAVAQALDAQRARGGRIVAVSYPGLPSHPDHALALRQMRGGGALVTITVAGGLESARRTFDRLRHVAKGPSLGGTESLASLPRFTTHARVPPDVLARNGIHDGMLRLSIGLSDPRLVVEDLQQALE